MNVSQLKYWLGEYEENENENEVQGAYLSYDLFLGLSIFGGFFGLDHLYLRSPWTAIGKFIINIMFWGVWWVHDALHALFNTDIVKIYGLGIPGWGPHGIGAGLLANDNFGKKHFNFFIYGVALCFGGIFGLDAFLLSDNRSGILRVLALVSFIFAPLAVLLWGMKLFEFFVETDTLIGNNSDFFGGPSGMAKLKSRYSGIFGKFLNIFSMFSLDTLLDPIAVPLQTLATTAETAVGVVDKSIDAVSKVTDAIHSVGEGVTKAIPLLPGANPKTHTGGSQDLNILSYLLIGTFIFIIISGIILTYNRANGNDIKKDDSPPEPGVVRNVDSEYESIKKV